MYVSQMIPERAFEDEPNTLVFDSIAFLLFFSHIQYLALGPDLSL